MVRSRSFLPCTLKLLMLAEIGPHSQRILFENCGCMWFFSISSVDPVSLRLRMAMSTPQFFYKHSIPCTPNTGVLDAKQSLSYFPSCAPEASFVESGTFRVDGSLCKNGG